MLDVVWIVGDHEEIGDLHGILIGHSELTFKPVAEILGAQGVDTLNYFHFACSLHQNLNRLAFLLDVSDDAVKELLEVHWSSTNSLTRHLMRNLTHHGRDLLGIARLRAKRLLAVLLSRWHPCQPWLHHTLISIGRRNLNLWHSDTALSVIER